jgi:hypothetical protein
MQKCSAAECIKTSVAGNVWLTAWLEPGDTTSPIITTFSKITFGGTLEQNHRTRPFTRRHHACYDHTHSNLPIVPNIEFPAYTCQAIQI